MPEIQIWFVDAISFLIKLINSNLWKIMSIICNLIVFAPNYDMNTLTMEQVLVFGRKKKPFMVIILKIISHGTI